MNGRISSRSYPRYRLARAFFRRVLADVDRFCMQSDESARRIIEIGAEPSRVTITGSLKFDSLESPAAAAGRGEGRVLRYFRIPSTRPVFMAANPVKGEGSVLAAFATIRRLQPNTLLIIAPRKPERFGDAEALARAEGHRVVRRTELAVDAEPRADVVILDTIGELAHLLVATVVFVGGSLIDQGGHNILEPAVHGKPIVFGPHMTNFTEIVETFLRNQAAVQVNSPAELSGAIARLLGDDQVERALAPPPAHWSRRTGAPSGARSTASPPSCPHRQPRRRTNVHQVGVVEPDPSQPGGQRRQPLNGRPRKNADRGAYRADPARGRGRPAILSRECGRRVHEDGVVVVSDGEHLLADIDRSGDEPLMLARAVPGAAVFVCDQRALAGALAGGTSARRCTCWTTDFSTGRSRVTSTSSSSRPRIFRTVRCHSDACAAPERTWRGRCRCFR